MIENRITSAEAREILKEIERIDVPRNKWDNYKIYKKISSLMNFIEEIDPWEIVGDYEDHKEATDRLLDLLATDKEATVRAIREQVEIDEELNNEEVLDWLDY